MMSTFHCVTCLNHTLWQEFKCKPLVYHGGMSTSARTDAVDRFQGVGGAGPPVMLVSLKAGGVGLNLTAANHVVMYDLWWNPAVEQQVGVVVLSMRNRPKVMQTYETETDNPLQELMR